MDKRTIIAFIIIGLLFLFYDDYLRWLYPPQEEADIDSTDVQTEIYRAEEPPQPVREPVTSQKYISPLQEDLTEIFQPDEIITETFEEPEYIPEEFILVETDRIRAKFTNIGARLLSFQLKPNGSYLKQNLELIPAEVFPRPGFRFWTYDGAVETSQLSFRVEGDFYSGDRTINLSAGETEDIEFIASLGEDRSLSVIYTFRGDGYTFDCEITGRGLESTWVRDYVEVYWSGGLADTEKDSSLGSSSSMGSLQMGYYSKSYIYFEGDELEDMKANKKKTEVVGPLNGNTKWGAVRNKYFMAALIPEVGYATGGWMESLFDSTHTSKDQPNRMGVGLRIPIAEGVPVTPLKIFIGPIDYEVLGSVDPSLRRTMDWGWSVIAPFSKAVLWALNKLGHIIPNYGITIIIFSILIKIIIWPLTRKSYQSMAAMSRLQPRIKELREKYKKEPQRIQKEMMKLYKAEKVNPMGGCLPMLLQMPLLFALFIVFRSTIEFRNAPFMLWITDLSKPDVLFHLPFSLPMYGAHVGLLPILIGISTYFQSKVTMTDPNQKMMLYFMPIFMLVIFNQFPSGLNLYYTMFNILTIIQQKITPPPKPATG